MPSLQPARPEWIIVRLEDDLHWWMKEGSQDLPSVTAERGLLDPRQVAHLTQVLDAYRGYGFRPQLLAEAFQAYAVEAELADGRARLRRVDESIYNTSEQLFALPLVGEEGSGRYSEFLDALAAARIQLLNSTHQYVRECSAEEMYEELDALDNDRYFNTDTLHAFVEISEILEWKPAEWDDPES